MSNLTNAINEIEQQVKTLQSALTVLYTVSGATPAKRKYTKRGASVAAAPKKVTRNWSPAARKAAALRMKRYWAARRKAAK